jgi:hypothetical protein
MEWYMYLHTEDHYDILFDLMHIRLFVGLVDCIWTLEDTEGAMQNGQSRKTGNIGQTRRKKTQNTTQYVLDTTTRKQTLTT